MHAAASRPAGRPETQTQAAANHCGPQVTEHQVYIVVASAVCVCVSLSHTVTHTHNQYVQRRSPQQCQQQTSDVAAYLVPHAAVRTVGRRTVAVEACTPPSSTACPLY